MPAPQRLRFSKRRNGRNMTTIPMALHLEDTLVDFVAERMGISRARAADQLVKDITMRLSDTLAWGVFTVDTNSAGEPTLTMVHTDNVREALEAAEDAGTTFKSIPGDGAILSYQN